MAIPIIKNWKSYFEHENEGMGSSYERIVLNDILQGIVKDYDIQSALESPSFGFTGLSGINLLQLALNGIKISLEDHDPERIELIKALWQRSGLAIEPVFNPDYIKLDYEDNSFDLSFSFSALWFCHDLSRYLAEVSRISKKCIFISVPNRQGLGYKSQVQEFDPLRYPDLHISHIDPPSVIKILANLGWKLVQSSLFDCPPWPDIGMSKEDFLHKKLGLPIKKRMQAPEPETAKKISIMDYYQGLDSGFADKMRRLSFVEKHAPQAFKRIWAHHIYMLFIPG